MKQNEIFLAGEGDNFFLRNHETMRNAKSHDLKFLTRNLSRVDQSTFQFLEIGCSNGLKTEKLAAQSGWIGHGLDPSSLAIEDACERTSNSIFKVGTAENLPYADKTFDLCYYAFCLYLIDRNDLPRVFSECERVLRERGFIAILDFDCGNAARKNVYKHDSRLLSYKENYSQYISALGYELTAKESYCGGEIGFALELDERYSITLFAKN